MKKLNESLKKQAIRMYEAWMRGGGKDHEWVVNEIASVLQVSKSSLSKLWKTKNHR